MPKQVDHEQRRAEIAAAVARLAATRGLQGVSFREVAAEAGMSVSLVQHYFGTKENLLVGTLNIRSALVGQRILDRLEALGPDATPLDRVATVASAFLPDDDESRAAMLLYHGFAAAALTDASLRGAEAFQNEVALRGVITEQLALAQRARQVVASIDPAIEARAIVSMILGLSLAVLLDQAELAQVQATLDAHLTRLRPTPRPRKKA